MNDTDLLNEVEKSFHGSHWGHRVLEINGWQISYYPEGFHVSVGHEDEPLIDECDLRSAIVAALSSKPV